ncbi:extracellular region [Ascochyta rabiei]|uniref:Extracellular region n=1 Tax=Didymella rabiei TaxID=5454 RepID=A0A163B8B4_DIDRA|nr:extracellular region [Ascochyta rabiei]
MPSLFRSGLLVLAIPRALAQSTNDVSAEYTSDDAFRKAVLDTTNLYRRQHDAGELGWNETLAETAGTWSSKCGFEHSGGPTGENLAAGYPNATAAISAWGEERKEYDFKKGEFSYGNHDLSWRPAHHADRKKHSSKTGHFTQLVWRNSTTVGCARTECNAKEGGGRGDAPGWYMVCEYHPAGNVLGQFTDNVLEQRSADQAPSAASGVRGSLGALWVGIAFALAGAL